MITLTKNLRKAEKTIKSMMDLNTKLEKENSKLKTQIKYLEHEIELYENDDDCMKKMA